MRFVACGVAVLMPHSEWFQNMLIKCEAGKIHLVGVDPTQDDRIQANLTQHLEKTNDCRVHEIPAMTQAALPPITFSDIIH
jgi:hypothetical protein